MKNESIVSSENRMGTMPIPKLITTMSIPAIIAMMVQALYNIVDSIFVSNVSQDALTAVQMAFPAQMLIIAVFVGLGVGINSLISRKLGQKDTKGASNVAEHGVLICFGLYIIILILGIFFTESFFKIFTDKEEVISLGSQYIKIITAFSFGRLFSQAGMSILQGTGDMVHPMKSQLIGAITNIILDPLLIFGWFGLPAMGVKGAAIATVMAQFLSMMYILFILVIKKHHVSLSVRNFKYNSNIVKGIIGVGLPATIMQGLVSLMLVGLNWILASFNELAVTALGVYFKVQSFIFMPIFGLSTGTMPVIGYNFGAKNKKRVIDALKFSTILAIVYMTIGLIIFQIFPQPLLNLFNSSPEVFDIGIQAFRIISISFPLAAYVIMYSTAFQGMGHANISMGISFIRQIIILLPVSYLFGSLFGLKYVWYGFIVSEIISVLIIFIAYKKIQKTQFESWA